MQTTQPSFNRESSSVIKYHIIISDWNRSCDTLYFITLYWCFMYLYCVYHFLQFCCHLAVVVYTKYIPKIIMQYITLNTPFHYNCLARPFLVCLLGPASLVWFQLGFWLMNDNEHPTWIRIEYLLYVLIWLGTAQQPHDLNTPNIQTNSAQDLV